MTSSKPTPFDIFRPVPASSTGHDDSSPDKQELPIYLNPSLDPLTAGMDEDAKNQREKEGVRRRQIHSVRANLFRDLLLAWANPPTPIDQIMGQDRTYIAPDFATHRHDHPKTVKIFDVESGVLAASVTPPVADLDKGHLRWTYSIWQAGDWLRFGVLIQGETRYLVAFDSEHDNVLGMERIWDRNADFMVRGPHGLLVEWRFKQPDLYDDFMIRERFVLVARHLHFRLSAMIDTLSRKIASGDFEDVCPDTAPYSEYSQQDRDTQDSVGAGMDPGAKISSSSELSLDGLTEDGSWNIPGDEEDGPGSKS